VSSLFDLPLRPQEAPEVETDDGGIDEAPAPRHRAATSAQTSETDNHEGDADASQTEIEDEAEVPPAASRSKLFVTDHDVAAMGGTEPGAENEASVSIMTHLRAGVADLAAVSLAIATGAPGALLLGVTPTTADWPAFALLAACFSFLYCVVPLAFWGQTPGMSWAGLEARGHDDEPLSFSQTAIRWLASVLTILLFGVPLLFVAFRGRSIADWLSGSQTLVSSTRPSQAAST
jgi:uncharacterized RDD family membrane protein YckC